MCGTGPLRFSASVDERPVLEVIRPKAVSLLAAQKQPVRLLLVGGKTKNLLTAFFSRLTWRCPETAMRKPYS